MIYQLWYWQWLGDLMHQAITWANVDLNLCCYMRSLVQFRYFMFIEHQSTRNRRPSNGFTDRQGQNLTGLFFCRALILSRFHDSSLTYNQLIIPISSMPLMYAESKEKVGANTSEYHTFWGNVPTLLHVYFKHNASHFPKHFHGVICWMR